ncbi:30S ribosomal protein S4 [Candidatus Peribacteria bacterium RIFCSPHIGHO2_02_FULL_52_16]|nr:MAG: 30S ribosomal protein S4 [Candidatus Peribacteria bacterium RIFCSPHIGHO2_01_FULL_51_35]OGJ61439.1 MAG: 30S ribosomal protein S4 [Candidatus Peribacteria bacterium RIFCSPHIGHO2_02_FULL_52_16]
MKYTGPKARKVRRHGVNIYYADKYDKVLQRKPYGPGKGPKSQQSRLSEYGQQLKEKQKARDMFGLSEKQFSNLYAVASRMTGQTGDILKRFLEERLDNVIFRAGLSMTRMQSRQMVGHGLFTVDGVRVTRPSYRVRVGQVITVRAQSRSSPVFPPIVTAHDKYMPPSWLKVDTANLKIEVSGEPDQKDMDQSIDMRQIIEFYSRN